MVAVSYYVGELSVNDSGPSLVVFGVSNQYCSLSFVVYCKSTVLGLHKMEPTLKLILVL